LEEVEEEGLHVYVPLKQLYNKSFENKYATAHCLRDFFTTLSTTHPPQNNLPKNRKDISKTPPDPHLEFQTTVLISIKLFNNFRKILLAVAKVKSLFA
jgi:hypothetical protein